MLASEWHLGKRSFRIRCLRPSNLHCPAKLTSANIRATGIRQKIPGTQTAFPVIDDLCAERHGMLPIVRAYIPASSSAHFSKAFRELVLVACAAHFQFQCRWFPMNCITLHPIQKNAPPKMNVITRARTTEPTILSPNP